jgi:hypothetical protein
MTLIRYQSKLGQSRRFGREPDGTPDFHALRSQRRGHEAVLYAFDPIEQTASTCATCR